MTTWPVANFAPVAGAWSDGGGCRVMFTLMLWPRQAVERFTMLPELLSGGLAGQPEPIDAAGGSAAGADQGLVADGRADP